MKDATPRRPLDFHALADAAAEAERLMAGGYERVGAWDLSQVCHHLADWATFPIDGYPSPPVALRPVFWVARRTVAGRILRKVLADRRMPRGTPAMPQTVHPTGGDEAAAVARLRAAVDRLEVHAGPLKPSPLFGALDRATTVELQKVHCAHHLGFLKPAGGGG